MDIRVECYAGHRGEETPRRLEFGQNKIRVKQVVDRWLTPDYRYFKVLGEDRAEYIIRHDVSSWRWELTFFRQLNPWPLPGLP